MAHARRAQGAGWAETSAKPGPSGPEEEREATQILPAGRDFLPKGPHPKRRFGSFAAVGKGTRRRGGGTTLIRRCSFLFAQKGTKNAPGFVSEERQRSSRQPRTPLRGTLSGQLFLEPGAGGTVDCPRFRAAAAGWDFSRKPGKLEEKSAPVATSRRSGSGYGGRMVSAPTQRMGLR